MSPYGFYFDKEKCIGCCACEVACQVWNDAVQSVKWRNVSSVLRGSYPKISSVNASLACMHCAQAPCEKACPREAINKDENTGIVTVSQCRCIGCMLCLWACPFGAPQLGIKGRMEKCTFCEERPVEMKRACEEICPQQAIVSGIVEELSLRAKKVVTGRLLYEKNAEVIMGHEDK